MAWACRFVQELRKKMLLEPNVTVVVGVVSKLLEEKGKVVGVQYKVDSEQEGGDKIVKTAYAPVTIVADGLWSGLRKEVDAAAKPKQMSSFVGLILQHPPMQSQVPFRGRGHVVLGDPSPILLYQISSTETRVLVGTFARRSHAASTILITQVLTHAPSCACVPGGHPRPDA